MILILAKVLKLPAEQFKHDHHYLFLISMIILINTMIILTEPTPCQGFFFPRPGALREARDREAE